MLCRPEPTKERVEQTILSIIAIEITHLTWFALLLLLRIQRYMWLCHVTTWANNNGRNWISTRFSFRICNIFCNIVFGLDLNLKNFDHFTGIWKRLKVTVWGPLPWSRYANTTLNHDKVSIYCALLIPQWKQSVRSTSTQGGETWSLKCSISQLHNQNRKFVPILIITEAINVISLCANELGLSIRNSMIL